MPSGGATGLMLSRLQVASSGMTKVEDRWDGDTCNRICDDKSHNVGSRIKRGKRRDPRRLEGGTAAKGQMLIHVGNSILPSTSQYP